MNNAIEVLSGQSERGADLVFVLFGDEITGKHFPVPGYFYFTERLQHKPDPFFAQEMIIGIGLRITNLFRVNRLFLTERAAHFADVVEGKVACHTADEPGEPFRFAHLAIPDLLQRNSEGLL